MKLIIWDADETLWEGKIIYGKVFLKYETKETLKQLNKLGIKQYVCSKNDEKKIRKQLEEFGLTKYIDGIKASWKPKNIAIKEILEETTILPEEAVFVDDEKINREEVKELVGCHTDYEKDLYNVLKYFDTDRLLLMKQERRRNRAEKEFKGTFKEFLDNSGMVSEIKRAHLGMLTRITNLANRTNELNSARNRYTEKQLADILNNPNYMVYIITLDDKYGSYGIIGEIIIKKEKDAWFIRDLCISCRVMGRGIGTKLLSYIIDLAKANNVQKIYGSINLNNDNFRMKLLYEKLKFEKISEKENTICYELNLK